MPATEQPLGAIPSSRSVSRLRRHGKHATDTNNDSDSRASSTGDDSTDPADMKKSSMDAAIDKVRERARKSVDERRGRDDSASQTRFSALLARPSSGPTPISDASSSARRPTGSGSRRGGFDPGSDDEVDRPASGTYRPGEGQAQADKDSR